MNTKNPRAEEAHRIRSAYDDVEASLRRLGKLLRTTHAGEFLWSASHKTAISGLCVVIRALHGDVPYYDD